MSLFSPPPNLIPPTGKGLGTRLEDNDKKSEIAIIVNRVCCHEEKVTYYIVRVPS